MVSERFIGFTLFHDIDQLVHENTRGNHVQDVLLCNNFSLTTNITVGVPLGTSDHCGISFKPNVPHDKDSTLLYRDNSEDDYCAIYTFLEDIDWIAQSKCQTVDEMKNLETFYFLY